MTVRPERRTRIPANLAERQIAAPGAAPARVAIAYVRQSESNWCWAACGEMLFPALGAQPYRQCEFATRQFNLVCCPSPSTRAGCDQGCWPDAAYPPLGVQTRVIDGALAIGDIRANLAAGKPVQVCYQWDAGGTHVALIAGEYPNGDLEVYDPWFGAGRRTLGQIASAYGQGSWLCTFTF